MKISTAVLIGILLGTWFYVSRGTLLVCAAAGMILWAMLSRIKNKEERNIILALSVAAIILRFSLCVTNYGLSVYTGKGVDLIPDARAYSTSGQYIANVITNSPLVMDARNEPDWAEYLINTYKGKMPAYDYRVDGYVRYLGIVYTVLGYAPLAVKFINSTLSVFAALLIFFFVRRIYSFRAAALAFSLYVFMPSIVMWSATGLKDSLNFFFVLLAVYVYLVHLRKDLKIGEFLLLWAGLLPNIWVSLAALCILVVARTRRSGFGLGDAPASVVSFLIAVSALKVSMAFVELTRLSYFVVLLVALLLSGITFLKSRGIALFFASVIILLCIFPLIGNRLLPTVEPFSELADRIMSRQMSQQHTANSSYQIYPAEYFSDVPHKMTPQELAFCYFRGAALAMLTPFPFTVHNTSTLFAVVQMMLIYFLIPFALLGILICLRYRWREIILIIFFMVISISLFAISEGNVGTAMRHRDVLTAFYVIFASIGICNMFGALADRKAG